MRFKMCTAAVLALTLTLPACSSAEARTAANFCSHYKARKSAYLQKYNAQADAVTSSKDPLTQVFGGFRLTFSAMGSMDDMFTDLAKVAPDEIQTEVEQVRDSTKRQLALVGKENPLSGTSIITTLLGAVMGGLQSSDAWEQVGTYIQKTCHTN